MVKPKKTKPMTPPKPRQTKSTPSSNAQKHVPPPKPQTKSSGGEEKRKKGKPQRVYVVATTEEETKFDEAVREVKNIATSARVVKKSPSSKGQPSRKPRVGAEQSERPRSSKKSKSNLDEALKSQKFEGNYTILPPITLSQIVDPVAKEGNLKYLLEWYENDKRTLEEVVVEYMNVYSKALIELSSMILKGLYEILDARRHMASLEDERIKSMYWLICAL